MHRGVKADVRSQRTMGSWLAGFLQLGECSSISITLLLVSQEVPGRVHQSLHTPPIHFMGNPLNVRGNGVTAFLGEVEGPCDMYVCMWMYVRCEIGGCSSVACLVRVLCPSYRYASYSH